MEDFKRILTEPKNSIVRQYKALLETEGIDVTFTDDAIDEIARFAFSVNETTEDIGARRLHTIMETLLDEYSFEGPDLEDKNVIIDANYVQKQLAEIVKNEDLSRYIFKVRRQKAKAKAKSVFHLRFSQIQFNRRNAKAI